MIAASSDAIESFVGRSYAIVYHWRRQFMQNVCIFLLFYFIVMSHATRLSLCVFLCVFNRRLAFSNYRYAKEFISLTTFDLFSLFSIHWRNRMGKARAFAYTLQLGDRFVLLFFSRSRRWFAMCSIWGTCIRWIMYDFLLWKRINLKITVSNRTSKRKGAQHSLFMKWTFFSLERTESVESNKNRFSTQNERGRTRKRMERIVILSCTNKSFNFIQSLNSRWLPLTSQR